MSGKNDTIDAEELYRQEMLILVKTDTGEVVPLAQVLPEDRARYLNRQTNWAATKVFFYIGMQEREKDLVKKISGNACRVIMYLKSVMYITNEVHQPIFQIADAIGMNKTLCYKAFKELVAEHAIVNLGNKWNPKWLVDPRLGFKGSFSYQKVLLSRFMTAVKTPETNGS